MNVQLQKCNVCKSVNTEEKEGWVRLQGVGNDPKRLIIGQVDVCPDCAGKTTVSQLPAIALESAKAARPQPNLVKSAAPVAS